MDSATVAEEVLLLLGWAVKRDESGHFHCFASSFSALGVVFDLSMVMESELQIWNKPERVSGVSTHAGGRKLGEAAGIDTAS